MLKVLSIKNLILIDSCTIEFHKGLNILSGETGAGKTALLEAIALVTGQRADLSCIRHGCDKACIEAAFDIEKEVIIHSLLQEAGIDFDPAEFLVFKREIAKNGRNRAFLNCQMVPLSLLQKIGAFLIDQVGQHSHQELKNAEAQRSLVDLFSETKEELVSLRQAIEEEKEWQHKLNELLEEAAKRERILETILREKQELEEASLQEGEEEKLFEEYQRLAHAQELTEKSIFVQEGLEAIPFSLTRFKQQCEQLAQIDSSLQECVKMLHEAIVNIQETTQTLRHYSSHIEINPSRLIFLEERLKLISRLKRKYNNPLIYLEELQSRYAHLENLDEKIAEGKSSLSKASFQTEERSTKLSQKRKQGGLIFEKALTTAIRELNMPHALFRITIDPQERTLSGEDLIQFWLSPNQGEKPTLVKETASGGELSRLLLAIKATLAQKNQTPTLVFDEIDANVGGRTASIIGEKLRHLGTCRQVLCITHFPQVASFADHHLHVFKEEIDGRTSAFITTLSEEGRKKELARMIGD